MDIGITVFGLSLLAGLVTTLSPCVLPLLPIVAASAMIRRRRGLFALAAGMSLSFTLVGVTLASVGLALGLNGQVLRTLAALLMVLVAIWLLSQRVQRGFSAASAGLGNRAQAWLSGWQPGTATGQLGVGLLLGLVWVPCVGPTLGAAITLASQGQSLTEVSLVMLVFSLGAVLPLMAVGLLARSGLGGKQARLSGLGRGGRTLLGMALLLVGGLVLTGLDKTLEIWLLQISPAWLIELSTRF